MADLPWLEPVWQGLIKRQVNGGLPHAIMFSGVRGIGKHHLALKLAQWLLCDQAQAKTLNEACGSCHSCNLWKAGSHPDMLLCEPVDNSKQIRVESIRKVNDFLAQTSQISKSQVVIMRPIEVMNLSSASALLKTLEEPAGSSYLILEAERYGSVLPTIRSRCQRVVVAAPSMEQGLEYLSQQGITTEQATLALNINQGAPLAALRWISEESEPQQQWFDLLKQWSAGDINLQTVSEKWAKLELIDVIYWMYLVLLDGLKDGLQVSSEHQNLQGRFKELQPGATLNLSKLLTLQTKVQSILAKLQAGLGNYNKQLLCESLLLDWQEIIRGDKA